MAELRNSQNKLQEANQLRDSTRQNAHDVVDVTSRSPGFVSAEMTRFRPNFTQDNIGHDPSSIPMGNLNRFQEEQAPIDAANSGGISESLESS